ncbi:hypothetical protein KC346_g7519, partial [Hortaea werneckii]
MAPTRGDRSPAASRATESETSGDDDMDFELAESTPSGVSDDMDEEEDAGNTTLYFDAEEGVLRDEDGDEVTFGEDGDEVEEEIIDEDDEGNRTPQPEQSEEQTQRPHHITVTQQQILQLLSNAGLQGIFRPTSGITTRSQARRGNAGHVALEDDGEEEEEEDEDDDLGSYLGYGARRRRHRRAFTGDRYPKIPSEEGKKLMASGIFGNNDRCNHTACGAPLSESTLRKRRKLHHRMLDRELGIGNQTRSNVLGKLAAQNLVPSSKADLIVNLNARCYSGQFSEDGSFFFACGQDFKVRMYDTSNPYDWKYYK